MNRLFASMVACSLVLSVVFGNVAFAEESEVSALPPYDNTLHLTVTVKWGNVRGAVEHSNRTSFDGDVSVTRGSVELVRELRFERHDAEKDQITSKTDPVSWDSWIFNKWDGVRIDITAPLRAQLVVATDAGGLTIPLAKLVAADKATVLSLGDGREIVVKVNKIHTDPFLIRAYWGGPRPLVLPQPIDAEVLVADAQVKPVVMTPKEKLATVVRPVELRPYPYPRTDFNGALAVGNGATIDLLRTLLFEPGHGDTITGESDTQVSWNSFIYGHYDGVLVKAQLDQRKPRDDTLAVKFSKLEWSREISLAKLYVAGTATFAIHHEGKVYHLILQAIRKPFCEAQQVDGMRCLTPVEAEAVPLNLPEEDHTDVLINAVNKEE